MKALYDKYFPQHFTHHTIDNRMLAISLGLTAGIGRANPLLPALNILRGLRRTLLKHYQTFEGDLAKQYLVFDGIVPSDGSAFDGVHNAFIAEYEKAAVQSEGIRFDALNVPKRQVTCDASPPGPAVPTPFPPSIAPSRERPLKKQKIALPKAPPSTRSSGNRKHRSSTAPPIRRSARFALESKVTAETRGT